MSSVLLCKRYPNPAPGLFLGVPMLSQPSLSGLEAVLRHEGSTEKQS